MNGKVIGIVAAVAAVAAVAGFMVERRMHEAAAPLRAQAPAPAAAAAPAEPAAEPAPKVPETLPDFVLADRDGKPKRLGDWAGKPLLVNFWATWCPPCRREIPLLNRVRAERLKQNVEIVGIAVDFRDDVLAYVKKQPIEYPLLIGEEDGSAAVKAFGMQAAFPFSIFSDAKHRIVAVKIGELHDDDIALILDTVAEIDAGKLELPAARERITAGLQALTVKRGASGKTEG